MINMAYNWSKMVTITVPVGLNGWLYSGQITINGIVTKFSVGVETSLPEPVAAMIQQMIAVEEDNEVQTPDNLHTGSVTIPAGKALKLEAGARVEDEAGVLGAGGGGSGVAVDATLTQAGMAADAKVVGDRFTSLTEEMKELKGEADKKAVTFFPDLTGGYKTDGSFSTANTTRHTDYIPLAGYDRIVAKAYIVNTYYALAFFTEEKVILPGVSILGAGVVTPNEIGMAIPEGAAYCMLSSYFGTSHEYDDAYITLYPADIIASPLHGKKIAFLGDSITTTKYATHNYWQLIGEKTGCICLNYGVAKSRLATVEGDDVESFVTRAAAMDTSADCVVVMGGTNDVGLNTMLGEWASEDVTTFYGAMNALIALLRTNYPGKPIIFCTPIKRKYDTDNGFPDTMADLKAASATEQITMQHCVLAIKAKCARHGIPVIDLAEHSGFSPETPEYYYSESDNLHPSALGYVRIANMVHAELEKQFLHAIKEDAEGTEQATYTPDIQGYVNTDGTIRDTGSSKRTDYLALDGVTRIVAQYRITNMAYALAYFDADKTLMADVSIVGVGTDKDYSIDTTPPANAAYCIFSHYPGSSGYTGWVTLYS